MEMRFECQRQPQIDVRCQSARKTSQRIGR
jgi:hypothetical protein